jgi:hypothetical protein
MKKRIAALLVALLCATPCLAESNAIAIYFLYANNTTGSDVDAVSTATPYTDLDFSDISVMTDMLVQARGMDTYAIEINEKYDADFDVMVEPARDDINNGRSFTFAQPLPDLSAYTDIYLGVPVWWGTLPQPARSFMQQLSPSGQMVHFYSSHLGSHFGDMLEQIASLWPNATLAEDAYTISASEDIREQTADFTAWIERQ